MRIAFCLGGTDLGRSGLSVWASSVLPRLACANGERGGSTVVLGERRELVAYQGAVGALECVQMPTSLGAAVLSAIVYLTAAGWVARNAGADVLVLPAANRRATFHAPIPVVAVVHDFANFRVAGHSGPIRNAYRRLFVLGALRSTTEIVAVSTATRDHLSELLGQHAPPMRVVLNGVDTGRFVPRSLRDPTVADARRRAGLSERYVLYAARLEHPQKNHLRLIAAFARSVACKGHELALCGADSGAQRLVEEQIARRGLEHRVRLLGFVSDEDLPLLVAGASAVAMVGLCEGFGLPALEALSAGRPVVASTTGALPEVVGELSAPCDPTDVSSIAQALDRALGDDVFRDRCARQGPERARAQSWEATAQGILAACDDAMARTRA